MSRSRWPRGGTWTCGCCGRPPGPARTTWPRGWWTSTATAACAPRPGPASASTWSSARTGPAAWCAGGCLVSGAALLSVAATGWLHAPDALRPAVALLGAANGAFSIAAIGTMMRMASEGPEAREGVRMGLWGAAQAMAFGVGGLAGAAGSDLTRAWLGSAVPAYAAVFTLEALLFVAAALLALGVRLPGRQPRPTQPAVAGLQESTT